MFRYASPYRSWKILGCFRMLSGVVCILLCGKSSADGTVAWSSQREQPFGGLRSAGSLAVGVGTAKALAVGKNYRLWRRRMAFTCADIASHPADSIITQRVRSGEIADLAAVSPRYGHCLSGTLEEAPRLSFARPRTQRNLNSAARTATALPASDEATIAHITIDLGRLMVPISLWLPASLCD
jgi:hypothetical protein